MLSIAIVFGAGTTRAFCSKRAIVGATKMLVKMFVDTMRPPPPTSKGGHPASESPLNTSVGLVCALRILRDDPTMRQGRVMVVPE